MSYPVPKLNSDAHHLPVIENVHLVRGSSAMSQLAEIMGAVSKDLESQISSIRAAFNHQPTKGGAAEATMQKFFEEYYPSSVGVAHGQVVDAKGNSSKQHDVILYDAIRTPILYTDKQKSARLIPVEGVIAVVESKMSMQLSDLEQAVDSAKTLKSLQRKAYYLSEQPLVTHKKQVYGNEYDVIPPMYFLFAFEGPDPKNVAQRLESLQEKLSLDQRVDMGCIMNRGAVVNRTLQGGIDSLPTPGSRLLGFDTEHALYLFHLLASRYILQADVPQIALQRYIPRDFKF